MLRLTFFCFVVSGLAAAQDLPAAESLTLEAAPTLRCSLQVPVGHRVDVAVPLILRVVGVAAADTKATPARAIEELLAKSGFAVATLEAPAASIDLAALFARLRRELRIDQGGIHALVEDASGTDLVRRHREQFQTLTLFHKGDASAVDLPRLPRRRCQALRQATPRELVDFFMRLHGERALRGDAGAVAAALDDFHDAAANGDEARYFARLPANAVFLGTDGGERWTGSEFRTAMQRYFERESAWTYVPVQRHIDVDAEGRFALFDELLDNAAYGECRGSGVLVRRDGRWVLRQYNLSVPLPNELARSVAARIRAFERGAIAATTIVVVRHAEKADASRDPQLSPSGTARAAALDRALGDLKISAVYATEYQRTQATVAPLCAARGLELQQVSARETQALAAKLRNEHAGSCVVVCGHSNTVPALLKALGAASVPTISDDDYDHLFILRVGPEGSEVLSLRYGP